MLFCLNVERLRALGSIAGGIGLNDLSKYKMLALRRGVWFKVLNRLERALINLSIRLLNEIRSSVLADALDSILKKLSDAFEGKIERCMRLFGVSFANKLSLIAQGWGNKTAFKWVQDVNFIRFLAVIKVNTVTSW
jgi:hypothetical protein